MSIRNFVALLALGAITLHGCNAKQDAPPTAENLDQEMRAKIQSVHNDATVPAEKKPGLIQQITQEYNERKAQSPK
jgi:Fic family protein